MQEELAWAVLLERAVAQSACAGQPCRLTSLVHASWIDIAHLSEVPHDCGVCAPRETPHRIISMYSLQTTVREALVRTLALWLSHQHLSEDPAHISDGPADGDLTGVAVDHGSAALGAAA